MLFFEERVPIQAFFVLAQYACVAKKVKLPFREPTQTRLFFVYRQLQLRHQPAHAAIARLAFLRLHLPAVVVLQIIRCKALDLIRCHYSDFGPTLATKKNWPNAIIFSSPLKPSVTG